MKGESRMKFKISQTSDWDYEEEIDINNLGELINFCKCVGNITEEVIINIKDKTLEIYDTYRE